MSVLTDAPSKAASPSEHSVEVCGTDLGFSPESALYDLELLLPSLRLSSK